MRRLKTVLLIGGCITATGCSGLTQHSILGSKEGGYVSIEGDAAGIHALSDWQTGTINEVRTPEGQKGSYFQLREEQEKQKTIRIQLPKLKKEAK